MKKVHCLFWKEIRNPSREASLNKYGCHYDCQIFLCTLDYQGLLSLAETAFSIFLFHLSFCLHVSGMGWNGVQGGLPLFLMLGMFEVNASPLKELAVAHGSSRHP